MWAVNCQGVHRSLTTTMVVHILATVKRRIIALLGGASLWYRGTGSRNGGNT